MRSHLGPSLAIAAQVASHLDFIDLKWQFRSGFAIPIGRPLGSLMPQVPSHLEPWRHKLATTWGLDCPKAGHLGPWRLAPEGPDGSRAHSVGGHSGRQRPSGYPLGGPGHRGATHLGSAGPKWPATWRPWASRKRPVWPMGPQKGGLAPASRWQGNTEL